MSVIVPTLNPGPQTLRALIRDLRSQTGVEIELVIVDSTSDDGSTELHGLALSIPQAESDHGARGTSRRTALRATSWCSWRRTRDRATRRRYRASWRPSWLGVFRPRTRQAAPASALLLE